MKNTKTRLPIRVVSRHLLLSVYLMVIFVAPSVGLFAQLPPPPPPPPATAPPPAPLSPPQLDQLVARIALYPDPLLAQVLTASTFWTEIPEAAAWADQHAYLKGDALARAIQDDHLQWDPSILGLLPFPSVLDMMARDPA